MNVIKKLQVTTEDLDPLTNLIRLYKNYPVSTGISETAANLESIKAEANRLIQMGFDLGVKSTKNF